MSTLKFPAKYRALVRRLNLHSLETLDQSLSNMSYNTCESVETAMRRPVCTLRRSTRRTLRRTACPSSTFICFSYFHIHFEMSFHEMSGTLTSYFSAFYTFYTRLPCKSWKRSNRQYNFRPPVDVCIATQHDVGWRFVYICMDEWVRAINSRNFNLASFFVFMYFCSVPANPEQFWSTGIATLGKSKNYF